MREKSAEKAARKRSDQLLDEQIASMDQSSVSEVRQAARMLAEAMGRSSAMERTASWLAGEDSVVQVEMHNSGRSSATEGATEGDLEAPCPPSANSNAATKLEQLSTRLSEAQRTVMH